MLFCLLRCFPSDCHFNMFIYIVHVDAFFFKQRGPHGRLIVPNGSPSLNKELTYLLTYLSTFLVDKSALYGAKKSKNRSLF